MFKGFGQTATIYGLALLGVGLNSVSLSAQSTAPATRPADQKAFTQKIPGTKLQFDMVPIPGGAFKMGSPPTEKHHKPDEGPQVDVTVKPFYMGKFEVTWDLYNEFLDQYMIASIGMKAPIHADRQADAVSYPTPIYDIDIGPDLHRMGGREAGYPAVLMSAFAAKQFTKWLSAKTGRFYRLPTEAEWEYAARGGTTSAYFFGDDPKELDQYAWMIDNSELREGDPAYRKVGLKKPNPFGLYDIYGNVAEIVIDQYQADWYAQFDKRTMTSVGATRWPDAAYPRLVRGGHFEAESYECRSAARQKVGANINSDDPENPRSPYWWINYTYHIGFRVVSPVKEPDRKTKLLYWEPDNDKLRETLKRDREIRQLEEEIRTKSQGR